MANGRMSMMWDHNEYVSSPTQPSEDPSPS